MTGRDTGFYGPLSYENDNTDWNSGDESFTNVSSRRESGRSLNVPVRSCVLVMKRTGTGRQVNRGSKEKYKRRRLGRIKRIIVTEAKWEVKVPE